MELDFRKVVISAKYISVFDKANKDKRLQISSMNNIHVVSRVTLKSLCGITPDITWKNIVVMNVAELFSRENKKYLRNKTYHFPNPCKICCEEIYKREL